MLWSGVGLWPLALLCAAALTAAFGCNAILGFDRGDLAAGGDAGQDAGGGGAAGQQIWVQRFGDSAQDVAFDVAVDPSGRVALAGTIGGSSDFGGGTLISAGMADGFIASFDADGSHRWSKLLGAEQYDQITSVATTGDGGVVGAGAFRSAVDLGGGLVHSAGYADGFVVAFDEAGTYQWDRTFGGSQADSAHGVATTPGGDVIVAGLFTDVVNFGGDEFSVQDGDFDLFVVALDGATGQYVWSQHVPVAGRPVVSALSVDSDGIVFVAGEFNGTITTPDHGPTSALGHSDVFVVQFNSAGEYARCETFGGPDTNLIVKDATTDVHGSLLICGSVLGSVQFGTSTITSSGYADMYLVRLDPNLSATAARVYGGTRWSLANAVAVGIDDTITLGGAFKGDIKFVDDLLRAEGERDLVLVRLDADLNPFWSRAYSGTGNEFLKALAVDRDGYTVVAGYFDGTINLGDGPLDAVLGVTGTGGTGGAGGAGGVGGAGGAGGAGGGGAAGGAGGTGGAGGAEATTDVFLGKLAR